MFGADRDAALLACRTIADDAARLACFDRESAPLATHAAAPALSPEQKFGLGAAVVADKEAELGRPRESEATAVEGRLVAITAGADGRFVFTLDNGQVWRQLSADSDLLLAVGAHVTVVRGALGSFVLRSPSTRSCKVTRIR
ncbi:MAG: hypothetical protein JSR54_11245 [Proteobacteria bacterium]|nr:hypothetical protein [Pseudomonadota bacterium]